MHIYIFHRDLRIVDNTALINQIKTVNEGVVPMFVFTPEQIDRKKNKYFSNSSVQFMIESLVELSNDIKKKNGQLYFFYGNTIKVLNELNKINKIESIAYNVDYTPYAMERDKKKKDWAKKNDVVIYEKEDYPLFDILNGQTKKDNGEPYEMFTPFKRNLLNKLVPRDVDNFKSFLFKKLNLGNKYSISEKEIHHFYEPDDNVEVKGGRSNGLKRLANMKNFKDYSKSRDMLTYQTTKLSAYNHFTCVSIREVYHKVLDTLGKNSGIINELIWRDFYINLTYYFPRVLKGQISGTNKCFREKYDKIKWNKNKNWFKRWCDGTTGFPVVDAGMRQLNLTSFMHNRSRMITTSFLSKDLLLPWTWGEMYYANKLVDYSPMMNSGGHQWTASVGSDAQPYFRIFNPFSQAKNYDPDCVYIKKYIPELKDIPNNDILNWDREEVHNKWLSLGIKYFKPMVSHDEQRKKALDLYKSV